MTWNYLTLERTQMNRWTRKRWLKFRKRWRKQHHGVNFRWFLVEPKYAFKPISDVSMIFYQREPTGPLGMKIKDG